MRDLIAFSRIFFSAALLAGVLSISAHGLDVGGNINSRTGLENTTPSLRNSVSLFVRRNPVTTEDGSLRWVVEGSVTAFTAEDDDGEMQTQWVPDLSILRVRGTASGLAGPGTALRYRFGRIPFADGSRLIFSDRIDGARLDLDLARTTITIAAGYTGLLAGRNSGIVVSADDSIDREDPDTYSGSQRIVTAAGLRFPEFIGRQTATLGGLAQFDVRGEYEAQRVHSQYAYLQLDGPLFGDLYYELGGAGSFAWISEVDVDDGELLDPDLLIGLSGRLQTRLYLGANEESVIDARARYATGPGEPVGSFVPIATAPPDVLSAVARSDVAHFMLNYAYRPFAGHPGGRARSLEIAAYSAVDYPADFAVDGPFRGLEAGGRITTRFFSDLGARLMAGAHIPGDDDEDVRFLGRLDISTSF